jgi:hypothetical protein
MARSAPGICGCTATPARSRGWLVLAVILNAALFALLLGYTIHTGPASTWVTLLAVLALSFVFEVCYRKRSGRSLKWTVPA